MEDFLCELSLLEKRLENHRMSIQTIKLELNKKEDDRHGKGIVKNFEFLSKQSKVLMPGDLYNSGKNLFVDLGKSEVNAK